METKNNEMIFLAIGALIGFGLAYYLYQTSNKQLASSISRDISVSNIFSAT